VDPVSASVTVGKPREEVFAYLVDVANHPEFLDHFLKDWHLTREETQGVGAGVRFRVQAPFVRFGWADATIVEALPPYRILMHGRGGKFNRIRQVTEYELLQSASGTTRVEVRMETEPVYPSDRLLELFAGRRFFQRRLKHGLGRLRSILEEDRGRGVRATVAGG
jgi:uncharacterized protein YndB with AHSA1/START domain